MCRELAGEFSSVRKKGAIIQLARLCRVQVSVPGVVVVVVVAAVHLVHCWRHAVSQGCIVSGNSIKRRLTAPSLFLALSLSRLLQSLPICQIFIEISMNVSGIVKTHRSRSLPARFTMKMFRGDRILGFKITCSDLVFLCEQAELVSC